MKTNKFIRHQSRTTVTASDLAQSCVCEQQWVFDLEHGKKRTRDQERSAQAGIAAHAGMNLQAQLAYRGVETSQPDQRCFIASALYGQDAPETQALRAFRDRKLAPFALGRLFMVFYYRSSPPIAAVLHRHPSLAAIARYIVSGIYRLLAQERIEL